MNDDIDDKRTDIAQPNRFSRHLKGLKLTKVSFIVLGSIMSVTLIYIYIVLGGHIPGSSSSGDGARVPVATETISTESTPSTALSDDVDEEVLSLNDTASARMEGDINSGRAASGAGTRITTSLLDDDAADLGVFNLDGLEPIDVYEPDLDRGDSESFFESDFDVDLVVVSPEALPPVSVRPAAREAGSSVPESLGSELGIIARPPVPQTYNRAKSSPRAVSKRVLSEVATAAVPVNDGSVAPGAASQTAVTEKIATGLYTRAYAVNIHALNSDVSGSAILEIISQGPLKGSRLSASYERVQWTDLIRLRVTSLTLLSGQTVPVNAIVLDGETSLAAVSGDVDNHYLYRYGWWGFGSTLAGLGAGVESYASTSTISSGGVIETAADLNATEKALVAFGSIGSEIGTVLQQNLQRPPTITLEPYQELGVFFLEDVLVTREP
tara:strand:+ start:2020 stop:3339 length:1320 start_codon:yes stop_codon:yes gene_type:complete